MPAWSEATRGFSGRIADFPLTSILQILELAKRSGFLYARSFPKVAFLVFRGGSIIQAVSSMRRSGIGELLIAEGFIQKKDLDLALDNQKKNPSGTMLGQIFQEMNLVSRAQIMQVLSGQMKSIVQSVLRWKEGEFTFYASREPEMTVTTEEEELILSTGLVVQEVLKEMISEADRRIHSRAPISVKVVRIDRDPRVTYYTRDVSAGGLFLLSEEVFRVGESMKLEIWVPTIVEPVLARCHTVRLESKDGAGKGVAVQFDEIDPKAQEVLAQLGNALEEII
jgi:hypothetical protein